MFYDALRPATEEPTRICRAGVDSWTATVRKGNKHFLPLQRHKQQKHRASPKQSITFLTALCDLQFKSERPHHCSFHTRKPPTRGKYLCRSFIEMMSIWKQIDRRHEGEVHAKFIGATHPISHFPTAMCRTMLSVGPPKGGGTSSACLEHPQSI